MPESALVGDPLLFDVPVREGYKVLGGVVLYKKLGQGGMGAVYRGKHLRLGSDVALKVMAPPTGVSSNDAQNFVQRFIREAKTSAAVKHPNLIRVYDINTEHGVYYLIMDFIDGESAAARLKRKGKLGEREALEICLGAARGLGGAHEKGIVHRDVKPDNILIDKSGNVVVADLGLAKAFGAGEGSSLATLGLSVSQQAMGTPYYMSPEQTRSAKEAGPPADVWSLGVTLFQLLSGEVPWHSTDFIEIMMEIRDKAPKGLRESRPEVSEGTCALVERALKKQAGERFPDCRAMARDISTQLGTLKSPGDSVLADSQAGSTALVLVDDGPPDQKTLTFIGKSCGITMDEPQRGRVLPGEAPAAPKAEAVRGRTRLVPALAAGAGALVLAALAAAFALRGGPEPTVDSDLRARAMAEKEAVEREAPPLLASAPQFVEDGARAAYAEVGPRVELGEYADAMDVMNRALSRGTSPEDSRALATIAKWCFLKRFATLQEAGEWAAAEALAADMKAVHADSALVAWHLQLAQEGNIPPRARELLTAGEGLKQQKRFEEALAAFKEARELLNDYHRGRVDASIAECTAEAFRQCYAQARAKHEAGAHLECLELLARAEALKAGNPLVSELREKAAHACLAPLAAELSRLVAAGTWADARARLAHARELGVPVESMPGYRDIAAALERRDRYDALLARCREEAARKAWDGVVAAADEAKKLFPGEDLPADVQKALAAARAARDEAEARADDAAFAKAAALVERVGDDPSEAVAALEGYLRDRPDGRHVDEAGEAVRDARARADDNAFAKVQRAAGAAGADLDRAIAAYASYLQQHAAGRHADEVIRTISALRAEKDHAAFRSAAREAELARGDRAQAVAAYGGYLRQYPDGLHAEEAKQRIADLRAPAVRVDRAAIVSAIEREEFDAAAALLTEARGALPGDDELRKLAERLEARRATYAAPAASLGLKMRRVPGGAFRMGSEGGDADETPVRLVRLAGYDIGMHEVTNAQFERFDPDHRARRSEVSPQDDGPAVNVSWKEAVDFCAWLSAREGARYRLPTETEWEHAARGSDGRTYPWGDDAPTARPGLANWGEGDTPETRGADGFVYAAPVGSCPAGASPFGCQDMAGNVWEWCADWYADAYPAAAGIVENPAGPAQGTEKVIRGGCWFHDAGCMRCANRSKKKPSMRSDTVGFRVVREAR